MERPKPSTPWSKELFLWVGPDGFPFPMNSWEGLRQQRGILRRYMEAPEHASANFLRNAHDLTLPGEIPLVEVNPPAVEAKLYVSDKVPSS